MLLDYKQNQQRTIAIESTWHNFPSRMWRAGKPFNMNGHRWRYFYKDKSRLRSYHRRKSPHPVQKALWNKKKADYKYKKLFKKYYKKR